MTIQQTYVNKIKAKGKVLSTEEAKSAFNQAKDLIMLQLKDDIAAVIDQAYGDYNEWISSKIESTVLQLKEKK